MTHAEQKLLAWQKREDDRIAAERAKAEAEARRVRQEAEAKAAAERARAEEQAREATRKAEEAAEAQRKALAEGNARAAAAAAAAAAIGAAAKVCEDLAAAHYNSGRYILADAAKNTAYSILELLKEEDQRGKQPSQQDTSDGHGNTRLPHQQNPGGRDASKINQCDGCQRGLPVFEGMHYFHGTPDMICTADRYVVKRKEEDQRGAADAVRANMPGNKADSTELQPAPHQRAEAFTADCEGYGYMPPNFTDAEKAAAFEWLRSVDNRHAAVALCEWHRLKTAEAGPERVSVPRATLERWLPTIEAGADCNRSNDDAELRALLAAGSVK